MKHVKTSELLALLKERFADQPEALSHIEALTNLAPADADSDPPPPPPIDPGGDGGNGGGEN